MKWAIVWITWLALIAASFAVLETLGWHDLTFSRFMWSVTQDWPIWAYLWGNLTGGLAVHFWWHWSPPGSIPLGISSYIHANTTDQKKVGK